ncbi:hypothetical protein D5086_021784 [Populus alba]|uniref:Uncharacterized protein n=1 Tax=Populus alba TaxID=43335 RepID=A0ACC4BE44_POPAL
MMLAKAFQLAEYQARASAQCVHATGSKIKGINCSHLAFSPVHMKKTSSANLVRRPMVVFFLQSINGLTSWGKCYGAPSNYVPTQQLLAALEQTLLEWLLQYVSMNLDSCLVIGSARTYFSLIIGL